MLENKNEIEYLEERLKQVQASKEVVVNCVTDVGNELRDRQDVGH